MGVDVRLGSEVRSARREDGGDVVLTTILEHHSNDLPWRACLPTHHIGARRDGSLDLDDLDRRLEELELIAEDLRVQAEQTLDTAAWLKAEFARLSERHREHRRLMREILPSPR